MKISNLEFARKSKIVIKLFCSGFTPSGSEFRYIGFYQRICQRCLQILVSSENCWIICRSLQDVNGFVHSFNCRPFKCNYRFIVSSSAEDLVFPAKFNFSWTKPWIDRWLEDKILSKSFFAVSVLKYCCKFLIWSSTTPFLVALETAISSIMSKAFYG